MGLYQNFPYTNLHELNLDWLIEQLNKISSSSVLSVNGQTGQVILYENATVQFPNVPEDNWTIIRMADGTTRGIYFGADDKAYIVHGATLEAVYSANNQPPYPVTRVNGQTGDIILYQEQFVQLPSLSDLNMHNWTLFRNLNNMAEGIQFGEDGSAYIIHGTQRYLIYTSHDAPQGVVESVNGLSGTVVLFTDSQGDITFPTFNDLDYAGWILKRSINGTVLGIGFNEDGTLEFKCGGASYKIYTTNDPQEGYVSNPTDSLQEVTEDSSSDYWGLLRNTSEGQVGIIFENTNPDSPSVSLAYVDSNDQEQRVQLVTFDDIPASSVISVNAKSGIVVLTGEDIKLSTSDTRTLDTALNDTNEIIAHVENTNTATANISNGDFVIWKGILYKATTNITIGDTLSGSNLTLGNTTAFDELNTINNKLKKLVLNGTGYTNRFFESVGTGITITGLNIAKILNVVTVEIYFTYNQSISVPASGNLNNIKIGNISSEFRGAIGHGVNLFGFDDTYKPQANTFAKYDLYLSSARNDGSTYTIPADTEMKVSGTYVSEN